MPMKEAVQTQDAPAPMPAFSQAIKCNGMVYCSGSVGIDPKTNTMVPGGVADLTERAILNLAAVLKAAGSHLQNVVKVTVFLTSMENYTAMNNVYNVYFKDLPKPVSYWPDERNIALLVG
ncbi:MAG: hypothetical protein M1816_006622 [Peltula sp. TS41687]|nr:MAG: hypothetical protein M1816_006622 [Peltula sp. TS41687]